MIEKLKYNLISLALVGVVFALLYFVPTLWKQNLFDIQVGNIESQALVSLYSFLKQNLFSIGITLVSAVFGVLFLIAIPFPKFCKILLFTFVFLQAFMFLICVSNPLINNIYLDAKTFILYDRLGENPSIDIKNFSIKRIFCLKFDEQNLYMYKEHIDDYLSNKPKKNKPCHGELLFQRAYKLRLDENRTQTISFSSDGLEKSIVTQPLKVLTPEVLAYNKGDYGFLGMDVFTIVYEK